MKRFTRRDFLKNSTAATAGVMATRYLRMAALLGTAAAPQVVTAAEGSKPALLGGAPVRKGGFPKWPVFDDVERKALASVLESGKWFRGYGTKVNEFEEAYAKLTGAKHCVATANGTSALLTTLGSLEVGPGDEVILPPYTFVATLNAITFQYALPVFADVVPETFQIDPKKIESAINERTAAIIPVHIGGNPADMGAIMEIAQRHNKIPVIEDACQAHLAEYGGKKAGTVGTAGCFSFQASKNLNSGEGGAVLTNDGELIEKMYAYQNNLRGRKVAGYNFTYRGSRGANFRLTEFQAALLLAQMTRVEAQSKIRDENAQYLSKALSEIPGCSPVKLSPGATRNAWHLYMFRFNAEQFGMPREKFMKALDAEGISCSSGYSPLNKEEFIKSLLQSKAYRKIYPAAVLDSWAERSMCPANDKLCQEAVWFTQTMLLGPRQDMDDIIAAIQKIHANAAALAKA